MKTFVLAVFLTVAQALLPVPGKAADNATGTRGNIQSQGDASKKPTPPRMVLGSPIKAISAKGDSPEQSDKNTEHSIIVRELPPVTINTRRNWADWGYWAFSGLLVVVSGLQVWLLWKTLGAITRQANLMHDSLVATFRPKLIIRKISIEQGDQMPRCDIGESGEIVTLPDLNPWKVTFEFSNIGQGAAHVLDYSFAISRLEKELATDIDYMKNDVKLEPFSLEPGEQRQLSIDMGGELVKILRLIGVDGLAKGYQNTDHIFFFGAAQYTDDLGTTRNLEACRQYRNTLRRFIAVDDPDREYSD